MARYAVTHVHVSPRGILPDADACDCPDATTDRYADNRLDGGSDCDSTVNYDEQIFLLRRQRNVHVVEIRAK